MIGNGPIIETHVGTSQCAVLGHPASHSGPPHFERTCGQFGTHDFDHARFGHASSFEDGLKRGAIFPRHLNHSRHIPRAEGQWSDRWFGHGQTKNVQVNEVRTLWNKPAITRSLTPQYPHEDHIQRQQTKPAQQALHDLRPRYDVAESLG
jgi:hypothetical protein